LISLFRNEPGAEEVEQIVRRGGATIASVNLAEVVDQLQRVAGAQLSDVVDAVSTLVPGTISLIEPTMAHAVRAAEIRARRYHRTRSALSLADCFALSVAADNGTLATADGPLLRAVRAEGTAAIPLRDSRGRRANPGG
jgi:uncharacterized protein with PIN domain